MNFFDMGIGEIVLILIVALIIWGPGKIPELGRMLGKMMNSLKRSSFDLTTQIRKELDEDKKAPPAKPSTGGGKKAAGQSETGAAGPDRETGKKSVKDEQ